MAAMCKDSPLHRKATPVRSGKKSPPSCRLGAIEYRPIETLKPYARNARTHDESQIEIIARSIEEFGFLNPILIDANGRIICGHGRWRAAKQLGLTEVPTLCALGLTPAQIAVYRLNDNRAAEKAGWDAEILSIELQHISSIDVDFDLTLTGFEAPVIDQLFMGCDLSGKPFAAAKAELPEPVPALQPCAVSRLGDLWVLGKHRLLCGSALDANAFRHLMGRAMARLVATDPPYNKSVANHVLRTTKHREFAMASGEMSEKEYQAFLRTALQNCTDYTVGGGNISFWTDWRALYGVNEAATANSLEQINLVVWVKPNAGMGSLWRSQHELLAVYKKPGGPQRNNVQLGRYGRNRTNVVFSPGCTSFGEGRELLGDHPTVKPVSLVQDLIRDVTNRGEIVLDPFLGSGTAMIAAESSGRICRGIEIDPLYVDLAVRRWQELTGGKAIREGDGRSFDAIARAATRAKPLGLFRADRCPTAFVRRASKKGEAE